MILSRSNHNYQSCFCLNANNRTHGCTNRGYASAPLIADAVLGAVMTTLITDHFLAGLGVDRGEGDRSHARLRSLDTSRIPWASLMAKIAEDFPLACPACGGDIRLIAFIIAPAPIRKILEALDEPLAPRPLMHPHGRTRGRLARRLKITPHSSPSVSGGAPSGSIIRSEEATLQDTGHR